LGDHTLFCAKKLSVEVGGNLQFVGVCEEVVAAFGLGI
jgi:hypothetical protein